jgi:hypothetical protein
VKKSNFFTIQSRHEEDPLLLERAMSLTHSLCKVVVEIDFLYFLCVVMDHSMLKSNILCFEQIQYKRPSLS